MILGLRDFTAAEITPAFSPWRRHGVRGSVILLVLAGGASGHFLVWTYRGEIMQLGMNLLGENRAPETIGISTSSRLSASFDVQGSLGRVLRTEGLPGGVYLRAMSFDEF